MKNYKYHIALKTIACITILVLSVFSLRTITAYINLRLADGITSLGKSDYTQSIELADEINHIIEMLMDASTLPKDSRNSARKDVQLKEIDALNGIHYYVKNGKKIIKNNDQPLDFFENQPVYYIAENGMVNSTLSYTRYFPSMDEQILYVAASDAYIAEREDIWLEKMKQFETIVWSILLCSFGIVLAISYLIFAAGKNTKDDGIHLPNMDKLYSEILFFGIVLCIAFPFFILEQYGYIGNVPFSFFALVVIICVAAVLCFTLSIVRKIKAKTIFKQSFTYIVLTTMMKRLNNVVRSLPVFWRMLLVTPKKARQMHHIQEGLAQFQNGNLDHIIPIYGTNIYATLAKDINNITEGLKVAVHNETKSERLKTELLTNVSHDIRTPLTSIITYIELIQKEGVDSKNMAKYIAVLEKKSARLKMLTDDLFEAAKASSGNIDVTLGSINVNALLTQGIGELENKIQPSGLIFKLTLPEPPVVVQADGRLLWRTIENLFSNVFKYALTGTRVYIDVETSENNAKIIIKNTSAFELNVHAEELLERFKRGDEARSSEGSGLGLSIAKSLTEIQGGTFTIAIDGDLFKVVVEIPLVQK
ncbi:MAG: sensor histidine kinase [Bacilli bacterium]